jgi:VanZ family protein
LLRRLPHLCKQLRVTVKQLQQQQRRFGWLAALLTMLVAGADDIYQLWLPGHMAGWDDWFAALAGMTVGLLDLRWVLHIHER